ncbi:MAG: hypothetical protein AAGD10_06000 [Myxococcota bacterium]
MAVYPIWWTDSGLSSLWVSLFVRRRTAGRADGLEVAVDDAQVMVLGEQADVISPCSTLIGGAGGRSTSSWSGTWTLIVETVWQPKRTSVRAEAIQRRSIPRLGSLEDAPPIRKLADLCDGPKAEAGFFRWVRGWIEYV